MILADFFNTGGNSRLTMHFELLLICYGYLVSLEFWKQKQSNNEYFIKITFLIFRYCFFIFRFVILIDRTKHNFRFVKYLK